MSLNVDDLLKDPLFQLNTLLWLTQPLPEAHGITPLLRQAGFEVYAIAPPLALPLQTRLLAQKARLNIQNGVRPDVVLHHEQHGKFAFAECKASSFGPASSTAAQARALLILSGPQAAEALGLSSDQVSEALLTLMLPEAERNRLTPTIETLSQQLTSAGLTVGSTAVLGLTTSKKAVCVVVDEIGT